LKVLHLRVFSVLGGPENSFLKSPYFPFGSSPVPVGPSLFPRSFTPCTVPVPCGSDTTEVGCVGFTLLTEEDSNAWGWVPSVTRWDLWIPLAVAVPTSPTHLPFWFWR